jgi:hypothetical protein
MPMTSPPKAPIPQHVDAAHDIGHSKAHQRTSGHQGQPGNFLLPKPGTAASPASGSFANPCRIDHQCDVTGACQFVHCAFRPQSRRLSRLIQVPNRPRPALFRNAQQGRHVAFPLRVKHKAFQFPDQIAAGVTHADLVVAAAPKPYLICSSTEDFFR